MQYIFNFKLYIKNYNSIKLKKKNYLLIRTIRFNEDWKFSTQISRFDSSIPRDRKISMLSCRNDNSPITNSWAARIMVRGSSPSLKKRKEPNTREVRHVHKFTTRRGDVEYFYLPLSHPRPLPDAFARTYLTYTRAQGGAETKRTESNKREEQKG